MKYSNGGWLVKDGFEVDYPAHVYATKKEEDQLTLYAPFRYIGDKGATLDGGMMTVELTTPHEDENGIKLYQHIEGVNPGPDFDINDQKAKVTIEDNEKQAEFTSGSLTVKIQKNPSYDISFEKDGGVLTSS